MGYAEMVSSLGAGIIVIPVVAVLANVAIAKAYSKKLNDYCLSSNITAGPVHIHVLYVGILYSVLSDIRNFRC